MDKNSDFDECMMALKRLEHFFRGFHPSEMRHLRGNEVIMLREYILKLREEKSAG